MIALVYAGYDLKRTLNHPPLFHCWWDVTRHAQMSSGGGCLILLFLLGYVAHDSHVATAFYRHASLQISKKMLDLHLE